MKTKNDTANILVKIQHQLFLLEGKVDTLIRLASKQPAAAAQQQQQPNRPNERVMHKAICADCNKECEVPFRPTGDRPVYCKECFAKRRAGGGQPAVSRIIKPVEVKPAHKKAEKKKPAPKKRKKR